MSPFLLNACADLSNPSISKALACTKAVARTICFFSLKSLGSGGSKHGGLQLFFSLFRWTNTVFQVQGGLICNPKCPQRPPS